MKLYSTRSQLSTQLSTSMFLLLFKFKINHNIREREVEGGGWIVDFGSI